MIKKQILMPTNKEINNIIKYLIPNVDIYFFCDLPSYIKDKIIPISVFKQTDYYSDIHYQTFYEYWIILKKIKYVWIDDENEFCSLDKKEQKDILKQQILLQRGTIIQNSKFKDLEYAIDNNYVLTNNTWNLLSKTMKKECIIWLINDQEDNTTSQISYSFSPEFAMIGNKYLTKSGCNCLSLVLYCITEDEKYLSTHIDDIKFLSKINDYKEITSLDFKPKDIVLFYQDSDLKHASFRLDDKYFLNKNGQSVFNPITLQTFEDLKEDWNSCNKIIIRRKITK